MEATTSTEQTATPAPTFKAASYATEAPALPAQLATSKSTQPALSAASPLPTASSATTMPLASPVRADIKSAPLEPASKCKFRQEEAPHPQDLPNLPLEPTTSTPAPSSMLFQSLINHHPSKTSIKKIGPPSQPLPLNKVRINSLECPLSLAIL